MVKNVVDTGVGGEKHTGLPSYLQGCGTSRPNIRVRDGGPYSHYDPYHWGISPQGGPIG